MNIHSILQRISMNLKPMLLILALSLPVSGCDSADKPAAAAAQDEHGEAAHQEGEDGHEEGEDGHEAEGGRIDLTPAQIKDAGIELAQTGPATIRERLSLYGVIAPNAERMREVAARFPGVIRSVEKKIGDAVREGDVLARVEANESLQGYAVTAPLAGVVIARRANPGEQTGDKTLFTVADLSSVWVEMALFPRDVAKVHVGQEVRVKSPDTGLAADGKVVYVAPFGEAANQTRVARVLLDNPEHHWAPGLYVSAEVMLGVSTAPLAVRNEAIQTLEDRSVVFVQGDEGFDPRVVALGRSDGQFSEVLSGLEPGDTYAAKNSFILKAELGKGDAEHGH